MEEGRHVSHCLLCSRGQEKNEKKHTSLGVVAKSDSVTRRVATWRTFVRTAGILPLVHTLEIRGSCTQRLRSTVMEPIIRHLSLSKQMNELLDVAIEVIIHQISCKRKVALVCKSRCLVCCVTQNTSLVTSISRWIGYIWQKIPRRKTTR